MATDKTSAASESEKNAGKSADSAADSATVATDKAAAASESEKNAGKSAESAADSATVATDNAAAASESETNAGKSADSAAYSATVASDKASAASESEAKAAKSAEHADTQAQRAEDLVDSATGGSLLKGANLSDVDDIDQARENLNAVSANDERLSNAREWTAESVSEDEAAHGESTTRRAWSALRVHQAINAVVNAAKSKLLSKAGNLSELKSATDARKNLDVYSQLQVNNRLDKKVDKETTINGKKLDGDVTLSAADLDIDNAQLSESIRRMKINALLGETIYFK
ncbi:hypothetical protein [Salinivibrio socompensis]|uniref:hypothetical protein n=1 Tax=Salinivibrio socompensis TaxID=1510206 RepID=UPI00046F66E2|nr:hypothetical protein [Salinivibrio socompensis]